MAFKPKITVKQHHPKGAASSQAQNNASTVAPIELTKKQKWLLKDKNRQHILDFVTKGGVCIEIGSGEGDFQARF